MSDSNIPLKQCTKCGEKYPATVEYFHKSKGGKYGLYSCCKICKAEAARRRYIKNPEEHRAARRRYYSEHTEASREQRRQYYAENAEQEREYARRYNAEHPDYAANYRAEHREEINETVHQWAIRNRARKAAVSRIYRAQNREKLNTYCRNHQARKLAAEGTHTASDIIAQLKRQKGLCYYCGCKMNRTRYAPNSQTIDHVVPLSRGGRNSPDNLVIACLFCNVSKKNKLPHEWAKSDRLL